LPPPGAEDPLASIGYLVAAAAITVVGLVGYAVSLARRLQDARAQRRGLTR
jgi:hypothetical protein